MSLYKFIDKGNGKIEVRAQFSGRLITGEEKKAVLSLLGKEFKKEIQKALAALGIASIDVKTGGAIILQKGRSNS